MKEPVSNIMEKDVITVNIDDSIKDVMQVFSQIKIRHIPVVTGDTLVGIISYSDISRLNMNDLEEEDSEVIDPALGDISVNQLMKKSPITIRKNNSILEVAEIFANSQFHALPVTDNNSLVGIVTTTDLIRYMIKKCK